MLQIQNFTFNPFQENTYIIYNQQNCWIVDPGMMLEAEVKTMTDFIEANKLSPKAIINTHAHIDHILGVDAIANMYRIPFYIYRDELPILNNATNTAKMFGFNYAGVQTEVSFFDTNNFKLDNEELEILFVPGHSPGSVAFYSALNNWVISGDALFENSIGRTDLLMGDSETLIKSIKTKLLTLPEETVVYAGHGNPTTIVKEKKNNPFLN